MKNQPVLKIENPTFLKLLYLAIGITAGIVLSMLIFPERSAEKDSVPSGIQVHSTIPAEGDWAASTTPVSIAFSQDVDREAVENSFHMEPAASGEFSWNGSMLTFFPAAPLIEDETYRVILDSPVHSSEGQLLSPSLDFSFNVRTAKIIFLHPSDTHSQLWISEKPYSPDNARQLTSQEGAVIDYTAAKDGSFLVYQTRSPEGIDSLWSLSPYSGDEKMLLDCGSDTCRFPVLSPDGNLLAFFRISSNNTPGADGGLWLLNLANGTSTLLVAGEADLWDEPSWSSDNSKLAFADTTIQGIYILDLLSDQHEILPSSMGISGNWSPDGTIYMFSDLAMTGSQPLGVIYQADIEGKSIKQLFDTEDSINSYTVPVLSPDSRWLLTGVHNNSTGPGYQLVLYSFPDLISRQITSEPEFTFGAAVWHPSSNSFLFQKIENLNPDAVPSIWLHNLESGTAVQIIENAYLPDWLP